MLILRTLALSVWFPFALLPLIYLVSFYSQAQHVFIHLPFFNDRKQLPLGVRLAIFFGFRFNTRLAASFIMDWRRRAGEARTAREARQLMREFRRHMRDQRGLEKQLDSVLPEQGIVNKAALADAQDESEFTRAAFELLKEATALTTSIAGLRRDAESETGVERNQAIIIGLLVKMAKLGRSLIRQLSDGQGGEMQMTIARDVLKRWPRCDTSLTTTAEAVGSPRMSTTA